MFSGTIVVTVEKPQLLSSQFPFFSTQVFVVVCVSFSSRPLEAYEACGFFKTIYYCMCPRQSLVNFDEKNPGNNFATLKCILSL